MTSAAVNESRHLDTIVLGSGISGLACASRLFQHQHFQEKNRLLVLEGRDRIGGRVGSVNVNGSRLDTGANWIHGIGTAEKPNPLMSILPHKRYRQLSGAVMFGVRDIADELDHSTEVDRHEGWVNVENIHYGSYQCAQNKNDVISSEVAQLLFSALWKSIGELHEVAPTTPADVAKHTSVLKALIKTDSLRKAWRDIPKEYHSTLGALPQFVESMEAAPLAAQSAEHPEDIPGMSLSEFAIDDFDGDQVFLQDGYIAIVNELAKDLLEADLIRTDTEVKQIDWSSEPLSIETTNGSYTATNIVCTLPLGVLKYSQREASGSAGFSLFSPDLPTEKREAITRLGFGTLDKIFTVYSRPWWTEEPYVSVIERGLVERPFDGSFLDKEQHDSGTTSPDSFLGFTTELPGIAIHEDGSTSIGPQRLSVINLHALTGFPALSVFVACSSAVQIESFSDSQTSDLLHRAFTNWFGHETPRPDAIYVTRWAQDDFSRGSYSHMITGLSETKHREEFQNPIVLRHGSALRFAGEHTSRNHFATVHGALLSGWREAGSILGAL